MIAHLDRYDVDQTDEDPLVNRLLTAMVALYRDELEQLLHARDAAMVPLITAEGPAAFEADHAVLATIPIDLDAKIESLGIA
jgi:succinate dehydrogenase flavin-adding protein (antitoxin of CptAB toxin-antitoxin module)